VPTAKSSRRSWRCRLERGSPNQHQTGTTSIRRMERRDHYHASSSLTEMQSQHHARQSHPKGACNGPGALKTLDSMHALQIRGTDSVERLESLTHIPQNTAQPIFTCVGTNKYPTTQGPHTIKVQVGAQPTIAAVDTGAGMSIIHSDLA
jgi:hypothetical protein